MNKQSALTDILVLQVSKLRNNWQYNLYNHGLPSQILPSFSKAFLKVWPLGCLYFPAKPLPPLFELPWETITDQYWIDSHRVSGTYPEMPFFFHNLIVGETEHFLKVMQVICNTLVHSPPSIDESSKCPSRQKFCIDFPTGARHLAKPRAHPREALTASLLDSCEVSMSCPVRQSSMTQPIGKYDFEWHASCV